jgi:general secretion pathway protein H
LGRPQHLTSPLGRRLRARGVTLFEVLLVIGLIALMTGAVIFGSGFLTGARERAAVTLVVSSIRLGMTRANTSGQPVRLVFDLTANRLTLEETNSAVMLRVKDKEKSTGAGADPTTPEERAAREDTKRIMEGPQKPRPVFTAVKQFALGGEGQEGRDLGKGVKFRKVQTEHDGEARTQGRAYLYFWPRGGTERAIVQIQREGAKSDEGVTVVVSALTGRAKVEPKLVDLPESKEDEGYSEREEETP